MRSAPLIFVARISEVNLTGAMRDVAKPPDVGGPSLPTIPLHLARINADVLLPLRGEVGTTVEFYSWIWASGSHGGPRLFYPYPGRIRVLFLNQSDGYLHTVGDYPAYDLELRAAWMPRLLKAWNAGERKDDEVLHRLVALRLRAELEALSEQTLRDDFDEQGPRVNHHHGLDLWDLWEITSEPFVLQELASICRQSVNPAARFEACYLEAQEFSGRCEAYLLAARVFSSGFGNDLMMAHWRACVQRAP